MFGRDKNKQSKEPPKTQSQDLNVRVKDNVSLDEVFGRQRQVLKGVAGTLHITDMPSSAAIVSTAWELSRKTGKPVVIVVRAI